MHTNCIQNEWLKKFKRYTVNMLQGLIYCVLAVCTRCCPCLIGGINNLLSCPNSFLKALIKPSLLQKKKITIVLTNTKKIIRKKFWSGWKQTRDQSVCFNLVSSVLTTTLRNHMFIAIKIKTSFVFTILQGFSYIWPCRVNFGSWNVCINNMRRRIVH